MRVITFDVEHGSSHLIRTPNDQVVMIDAGNTDDFSPARYISDYWRIVEVRWLTVTHHDADHLSDIDNVSRHLNVRTLEQPTLSYEQLYALYNGVFSPSLEKFLQYRRRFSTLAPLMSDPSYDWGGVQFATFSNGFADFENPNINNLSVVTFAHFMGWTFIFPGDLERAGWLLLLEKPEFREWLQRVDVFVASHHGRESGYCEEVFEYCSPKLVLISDKSTAEATYPDLYRQHAQGLSVVTGSEGTKTRYVLTTRSDGAIFIHLDPEGRYWVSTTN